MKNLIAEREKGGHAITRSISNNVILSNIFITNSDNQEGLEKVERLPLHQPQ